MQKANEIIDWLRKLNQKSNFDPKQVWKEKTKVKQF